MSNKNRKKILSFSESLFIPITYTYPPQETVFSWKLGRKAQMRQPTQEKFRSNRIAEWLSRDPLPDAEMSQGPNLYAYCRNYAL
jgi:hypothetical protein